MGKIGATCDYTFHSERTDLTKAQWDKKRVGQVCTKHENMTNLMATVTKFCADNKMLCTLELKEQVKQFDKNLKKLKK